MSASLLEASLAPPMHKQMSFGGLVLTIDSRPLFYLSTKHFPLVVRLWYRLSQGKSFTPQVCKRLLSKTLSVQLPQPSKALVA